MTKKTTVTFQVCLAAAALAVHWNTLIILTQQYMGWVDT